MLGIDLSALRPDPDHDEDAEEGEDVIEMLADLQPVIELVEAGRGLLKVGGGMAPVVLGLDLPAFDVLARWMSIEIDRRMASDLMVISDEVAMIFREAQS